MSGSSAKERFSQLVESVGKVSNEARAAFDAINSSLFLSDTVEGRNATCCMT